METIRAWYRDDSEENLQDLHQTDPPQILTAEEVFQKTGLRYSRVEQCEDEAEQAKLRQEGGYKHFDWLDVTRDTLPNYDEKLKSFYAEHLHKDEEIRLFTAGSAYFEVRDYSDRWVRLHLRKGDLINLPPGVYHRMTLDSQQYVKMLRLYSEVPQWVAVNRPEGDTHPARQQYLNAMPTQIAAN